MCLCFVKYDTIFVVFNTFKFVTSPDGAAAFLDFIGNFYRLSSGKTMENRWRFDEVAVIDLAGPVFRGHRVQYSYISRAAVGMGIPMGMGTG